MAIYNPMKLPMFCVDCNASMNAVELDDIRYGQFMKCSKCNSSFNLWALYLSFYENIPLAAKIADSIDDALWGSGYTVKGGKAGDLPKIDDFLTKINFGELLKKIIFDATVFGQSFIQKTDSHLNRIDPASVEVEVGPEKMPYSAAYVMQVQKLVEHQSDGSIVREIPRSSLLTFITENGFSQPLGHSAYGMWLSIWFSLKLAPQALLNASFMGLKETKELDKLREYVEDQVITGSSVPKFVLKPEIRNSVPPTAIRMLEVAFRYATKRKRERLAREIEETIFPLALGRPYQFDNWPDFVWL